MDQLQILPDSSLQINSGGFANQQGELICEHNVNTLWTFDPLCSIWSLCLAWGLVFICRTLSPPGSLIHPPPHQSLETDVVRM